MAQEKIRLLLVEDDPEEVAAFTEYAKGAGDVELVGCTNSASDGLGLVREFRPDGVVLDLILRDGDGLDFLARLTELFPYKRPFVVVTTHYTSRVTFQALSRYGAGFILVKSNPSYSCKQVVDKFRMVLQYLPHRAPETAAEIAPAFPDREEAVRRRLSEDLERLGITSNLNGHNYIIDAVLMMIDDPEGNFDVSRKVYPAIARKYRKQPANVERSIRSAIETAWTNTPAAVLVRCYTAAIRPGKGRPMNKELICFFARKYGR